MFTILPMFFEHVHLLFQNWQEFGKFWSEHSKVLKICTLIGPFCAKYVIFDLKKYWGVIFHDTKESCKFWRKGFWQIFTKARSKVEKFRLLLGPFIESRKCMSLKFTEESCLMRMKNGAKFEEDLTCQFKIDMRNLTNFDPSTGKSQKFEL